MKTESTDSRAGVAAAAPCSAPTCLWCDEPPHAMRDCPACQDFEATKRALIRARKLLREAEPYLKKRFGNSLGWRVNEELHWPNVEAWQPDPGARPRWEDKDSNKGSQSTPNGIGLAIAD